MHTHTTHTLSDAAYLQPVIAAAKQRLERWPKVFFFLRSVGKKQGFLFTVSLADKQENLCCAIPFHRKTKIIKP